MSLARSSFTVGGLTLLSRLFGFVRDMLVANILGASIYTDAFFVAFKLPNFLRRLFAEGAFNSAFLPMFAGMLKTEGKEASMRFASDAYSLLFFVLTIITVLAIIFMPSLMCVLAPGFSDDPVKFDLTVDLTRITFPYIIFISLVCLQGGVLNSFGKFAAVAATPILMNIAMIGGLGLKYFTPSPAHALTWGVMIAGIIQYAWLYYFCWKAGVLPKLHMPRLTGGVKRLLTLIAPAALGAGVVQINLMVDVILASGIPNGVSYLYYADRLYELPLGVIGIAVATALLPTLSKHVRAGAFQEAIDDTNQAIMLVMLFGLPSTAALITIAHPLVATIFQHGVFSAHDTYMVFPALIAFTCSLPAFLLVKIFSSNFFAAQDTKTPVKIAVLCVTVNFIFNLILREYYAHVGLAMATTISGWLNASMLGTILYRKGMFVPNYKLGSFISKTILSCAVMSGVLASGNLMLTTFFEGTLFMRVSALTILIGAGGISFFVMMYATKAISPRAIKSMLKPSKKLT
jgi:putative peptidoglycan lipid II flippase